MSMLLFGQICAQSGVPPIPNTYSFMINIIHVKVVLCKWLWCFSFLLKSMLLFRQNRRLEMFLYPIEIPGWCSSAYDFAVIVYFHECTLTRASSSSSFWVTSKGRNNPRKADNSESLFSIILSWCVSQKWNDASSKITGKQIDLTTTPHHLGWVSKYARKQHQSKLNFVQYTSGPEKIEFGTEDGTVKAGSLSFLDTAVQAQLLCQLSLCQVTSAWCKVSR